MDSPVNTAPPPQLDGAHLVCARRSLGSHQQGDSTWRLTGNRSAAKALGLILLAVLLLGFLMRTPGDQAAAPQPSAAVPASSLQDQVDALRLRVIALEHPAEAPEPADPQPARASAPRAAVRPAAGIAAQPTPQRWGTTDLDREIDDFTRSLNQPEQAK